MKRYRVAFLGCLLLIVLGACSISQETKDPSPRLKVITTLFPLYDFARTVAGDRAEVKLLLPPGTEAHSFEPKPSDMAQLTKADLFIFTNRRMEPWAEKILKGADNPALLVVDTSTGIAMIETAETGDHHAGGGRGHDKDAHEHQSIDPHVWLDFGNAAKMVATIRDAMIARDPINKELYLQNAKTLMGDLDALDRRYAAMMATCEQKVLVSGGHFAFGYLAKRYGLHYQAAYGFSPSAEPSPRDLIRMSRMLRTQGIKHLFYEELIEPRIAETIAKETGVSLIMLHGAHNISRNDFQAGVRFTGIMERNFDALKRGLQCR